MYADLAKWFVVWSLRVHFSKSHTVLVALDLFLYTCRSTVPRSVCQLRQLIHCASLSPGPPAITITLPVRRRHPV